MTRLVLVRLICASDFTRLAMRDGRLTLCRTGLSEIDTRNEYTSLHYDASEGELE